MYNQVLLTGYLVHAGHNKITIKNGNKRIKIRVNSMPDAATGDLLAIKSFIDIKWFRLIIVATKIMNLSK